MSEAQKVSAANAQAGKAWVTVCSSAELKNNLGARALVNGEQIAMFRVQGQLFAISAIDPFSKAAVLSRGIVGDLRGQLVVASPIYKQHFNLATGQCLEDAFVALKTFAMRERDGQIQLSI
jgi:nitrite reductase (NADH) small subunit